MIKIIEGVIDRRILVNYRIDPYYLKKTLPHPFKPRLVNGYGLGGICLIRFKKMRPTWLPSLLGTSSENGTHRFCVEWEKDDRLYSGVYVKKRFTNSRFHEFGGEKIFPGKLVFSDFKVSEKKGHYSVYFQSKNKNGEYEYAYVEAYETHQFPSSSLFKNIEEASEDFRKDQIGYSPDGKKNQFIPNRYGNGILRSLFPLRRKKETTEKLKPEEFKGVKLNTDNWVVSPLALKRCESSLFSDPDIFPKGSVEMDHVLLMKNIKHSWENVGAICSS